jgi:hypothetical protein
LRCLAKSLRSNFEQDKINKYIYHIYIYIYLYINIYIYIYTYRASLLMDYRL